MLLQVAGEKWLDIYVLSSGRPSSNAHYLFIFREREREGEREVEKHRCARHIDGCLSYSPVRDLAHNPDVRPAQESNQQHFKFAGWHSMHWATPARAKCSFLTRIHPHAQILKVIKKKHWELQNNKVESRKLCPTDQTSFFLNKALAYFCKVHLGEIYTWLLQPKNNTVNL